MSKEAKEKAIRDLETRMIKVKSRLKLCFKHKAKTSVTKAVIARRAFSLLFELYSIRNQIYFTKNTPLPTNFAKGGVHVVGESNEEIILHNGKMISVGKFNSKLKSSS